MGNRGSKRVAVVGSAFRFPSTDAEHFWDDLLKGRDLVSSVAPGRWSQDAFLHPDKTSRGTAYTFAAGTLGDVAGFDAGFFGISPREAAQMDPQQRLLLELAWEAFEDAGIPPAALRGSDCGVYIGIANVDYSMRLAGDLAAVDSAVATGTTSSIAANRLSYFFDLRGPSMAIDTACSSALVAFHQACRAIASGEIGHALVGGMSLHLHPYGFVIFSKASMLSRRGRCRAFDADGDGYVRSEGGGIFLLKDYDAAVADGDRILAVVAHTHSNTDGYKAGLTVPRAGAQVELLERAYREAGIAPDDIDYIEAHGTGTVVGDPIEAQALGQALGRKRRPGRPLPIGSIKSNLGHLEAAAGVAGVVKAMHALRHRVIPATMGIQRLRPDIPFADLNLEVVTENRALPATGPLTIGINSFGFGGANAHVILQNAPESPVVASGAVTTPTGAIPLLISAASAAGLKAVAARWAEHLRDKPPGTLQDIAYHAIHRREWLPHRAVVWGRTPHVVAESLLAYAQSNDAVPSTVHVGVSGSDANAPAFVYSGNGSQWAGMGRSLLKHPVFRAAVRQVDLRFRRHAAFSLEDELAGRNGSHRYERTEVAQPALFALQVGVTEMLRHLGIRPSGIIGHSVGEVAAAWACGALSLDDAVSVIFHRSRLQGGTKGQGQMTAVAQDAETVEAWLKESGQVGLVCIAGYNSPRGVTLAGPTEHLSDFEETLRARGITHKRLDLDYAFHSSAMDAIASEVIDALPGLRAQVAATPFYSTVSGLRESGETLDGVYWWRNVRQPVMFEAAITRMAMDGIRTFIEIGPHPVLRGYLRDIARAHDLVPQVITTLSREHDDAQAILNATSAVMVSGAACDWERHFPLAGGHVDLPHYPWQREAHWHARTGESEGMLERYAAHPLLGHPLAQPPLTWENRIDPALQPMLADHVVDAGVVFPGTAYVELALAAAREWKPQQAMGIESLEIFAPLTLPADKVRVLRLNIDPADGRLQIRSREHAGDGEWTLHASARLLEESGRAAHPPRMPAPTRAPDFDEAAHSALTRSVGLAYGPAFRAIDVGWVDGGSVTARFRLPDAVAAEVDDYLLHPALLDNAFQLIIQMKDVDAPVDGNRLFVPTGIGRVMHIQPGRPHSAHARLLRRSPHSMLADFTLYDELGSPLARIDQVRFRSLRTQRARANTVRHLVHELTPCPLPGTETSALPHALARSGLAEAAQRIVAAGMHERYTEEIEPLLDALCNSYLREALRSLGGDDESRLGELLAGFTQRGGRDTRYVDHLLARAEADGLLRRQDAHWHWAEAPEVAIDAPQIWHTLIHDYPDHAQIAHAVGRIGLRLAQLIAEPDHPVPAITPAASLAQRIVDAEAHRQIGQALHELVVEALAQLPGGQRLRLMEVHGSVPLFAADLCAALDFNRSDCSVMGLDAPLDDNSSLRTRYPALLAGAIPGDEGMVAAGSQQLIVMSLAFDSAEQAERAWTFALRSLAPQGLLVLLGHQPARWMDFVHGANPAWWPADGLSPQRSAAAWKTRLVQAGFEAAEMLPLCANPNSGAFVLVGRQPARAEVAPPARPFEARHWIILADRDGDAGVLARRLADQLAEARQPATLLEQPDEETLAATLRSDVERHGRVDGVIHMAGMAGDGDAVDAQVYRCGLVTSLMRSCETLGVTAPIWMLTHAALNGLLSSSNAALSPDAALWGFARSLVNEASGSPIRLVDLESLTPGDSLLQALLRELEQPDAEDEIVLGSDGARHAVRMQARAEPAVTEHASGSVQRLGLEAPGQLRNLRWETHMLPPPGPGEIEVEVHATGLNFRDVMYSLGLLPDEAIDGGFAGPTLGLEFAGTVRRVGAQVTGHAPGDAVMGFGAASFSTRVIARPDAIAAVPLGLSCEAAATIPSAFFTAYYALHHQARLCEGESVLIHGAAGGVGLAAIQIARWCGARVFVTAGSEEKRDFLQLLGVPHILDSRSLSFADEVMTLTGGQGIDVVLNSIAGEAAHRSLGVLKPFGRFVELGKRDFYENTRIGLRPFRNNITYFGVDADQLMQEKPALTKRLYAEVMALFADGVLHALPYQSFEADDCVDAFRFMQQARQIGKVIVTYRNGVHAAPRPSPAQVAPLSLSADATYLVSGGLSGFGLRTAQWLARHGARHLVLMGRRGLASTEAREAVAALQKQGVDVFACACDVTHADSLALLMREIEISMPPLKGVVHAAAVIHDGLVRNLDDSQIRAVLEPKMRGAWNLHLATRDLDLDLFVLYSSATAMFGNPGQASYVGANLWLDALARHRRALGLPATSVLWGAIDDVGFLARNEELKDAMQSRMGGNALPADKALDSLAAMLGSGHSGDAVLELDWNTIKRFLSSAQAPKFGRLSVLAADGDGVDEQSFDVPQMLRVLPDAELLVAFTGILSQQLGEVLRVPVERIDPQRQLSEMGLDSLMGLELIMALESRFSVRLPTMALSEYPTVARLAERLMALLRKGEPRDEDGTLSSQIRQVVDQHVTEFTAEQKASLSTQIRDDLDRQTRRIIHG